MQSFGQCVSGGRQNRNKVPAITLLRSYFHRSLNIDIEKRDYPFGLQLCYLTLRGSIHVGVNFAVFYELVFSDHTVELSMRNELIVNGVYLIFPRVTSGQAHTEPEKFAELRLGGG